MRQLGRIEKGERALPLDDTERQEGFEEEKEQGSEDETESQDDLDDSDEEQGSEDETDDEDVDDEDLDDEELDPKRLYKTVKNQRRVEKDLKSRIKELEGQSQELDKIKKAQKKAERDAQGETERLQSDLEEVQKERDKLKARVEKYQSTEKKRITLERLQTGAGFTANQAKVAYSILPELGVEPEIEGEQLKNRKAIVKAARDYDPDYFAVASADGGERDRSKRRSGDMNSFIRQMAGRE